MDEVRDGEDFQAEVMDLWRLFDVNEWLGAGPPAPGAAAPSVRQRRWPVLPRRVPLLSAPLTARQKMARACLLTATVLLACGLLVACAPDLRHALATTMHDLLSARR